MINYITITPEIFDFVFRPVALLSLAAVLVNSALIIFILYKGVRNDVNKWFALSLFCMVLWGIGEFLGRISKTPAATLLENNISTPGFIFVSVCFFTFTLKLIKRDKILSNLLFQALLYGPGFIFLFLALKTNLIIHHDPNLYVEHYYGWQSDRREILFLPFLIWLEFFFILSLFLLFKHYRKSKEKTKKRQTLFILIGLLIPLIGGTITEGILPLFGVFAIPTSVFLTIFLGIFITYAIFKYKLLVIPPSIAFYSVIETMSESLVVLSPSFRIEQINKAALELLGYKEKEILDEHIQKIIKSGKSWETFNERGLKPLSRGRAIKNLETNLIAGSGREISVNFSASPIKSKEEAQGIVAVFADITQTKNLIRKLEETNQELKEAKYQLERKMAPLLNP